MNRHWTALLAISALTITIVVVNHGHANRDGQRPTETSTPTTATTSAIDQPAAVLLAGLVVTVRPAPSGGTYRRAAFGTAWKDIDGNGCNQRDDVLVRDADPGTLHIAPQGSCDHDVLGGTWHDPYTGAVTTLSNAKDPYQAQQVQIDHVVPLAEAWRSGAEEWTPQQRLQYANTLANLLATSGPVNASKGDSDPAAWRPQQAAQCSYATTWITIKATWKLSVDQPEVNALRAMFATC